MDDYLMHYGVLGMRWGVRKANSYDRNEKRVLTKSYEKKMRELGYDDDTINLVKKKLNKRLKEKKKQNVKESRQQMELSKTDSTMTKEDFANKKYKAAKFKRYQKRKIDYDNRNIKRYKENVALYAAGLAMPGPIISDLIGLGAAVGNDVRSRKERKVMKSRLDKALNTEITSLANKITEKDIHKIIKHGKEDTMNSSDFNDLKELGNAYLEHYGILGMRWGHRKSPGLLQTMGPGSFKNRIRMRKYEKLKKKMAKKHPDLIKEEKDSNDELHKLRVAAVDKYHNDKKYRSKVNIASGLKKNDHVKPKFDDDMDDYDMVEKYLSTSDEEYKAKLERYKKANDAYWQAWNLIHSEDMSGETFNDMTEIGYDILEHHGRKGMHWGVQNGPPYPLNKEGLRSFREHLREKRAAKRRRKILNNPKKLAKHIDEFTPEELAEEAEKQHAYNDIAYQRKWGVKKQKEVKLSNKQKRMANNAVSLLQNVDEFNDEEYSKAVDRLHKREHLKDVIANSTQRPAQVIQSGANILYSVKSGAGSIMSMHDMYNKAFGGATYDESHSAWLNNNKEPVSGKLWSRVIGESNAAKEGRKYEYKDSNERKAMEDRNRADKLWEKKYAIDEKNKSERAKSKYATDEKQKTERSTALLDYQHKQNKLQVDYIKEQDKFDLYREMGQVPFQNVRTYSEVQSQTQSSKPRNKRR